MELQQHQRQTKVETSPLDVVVNVLSRLPARSIVRFRCVNKRWCSLTCCCADADADDDAASYFLAMRQKHAPAARPKIIDEALVGGRVVIHHLDDDDTEEDGSFDAGIILADDDHRLSNSVGGMACAYRPDRLGSDFHLLNPTTREASELPDSPLGDLLLERRLLSVGLEFDASAGTYKLVRIVLCRGIGYAYVLPLGAREWRRGSQLSMPPDVDLDGRTPACLRGVLYWSAHKRDCHDKFVLAFDVEKEKFEPFVPIPSTPGYDDHSLSMGVREWRGRIYVGVQYPRLRYVEVWMLEDHASRRWTNACSFYVDDGHGMLSCPYLSKESRLVAVEDGKVLLKLVSCERQHRMGMICSYDLESRTLQRIHSSPFLTGWDDVCTESLISPKKLLHNLSKKLQQ